jgi:catechol 2,3-dioxygenase-like lactoylglutathione lyase family enzyme
MSKGRTDVTNQTTAVEFAGAARLHVALEVSNLERSIDFYRLLLGVEPSKLRPGYAKFEPAEPAVNLTLNAGRGRRIEGSGHFGVQVRSTDAVAAAAERFRAAGLSPKVEGETECCYSVQDKAWVSDPDGNPWEVFVVTTADAPRRAPVGGECCGPAPASAADPAAATATATRASCCGGA